MDTEVIICSCANAYQDQRYGLGRRIANQCRPAGSTKTYRCTVCGKEHNTSGSKKK